MIGPAEHGQPVTDFIQRWHRSSAAERANYQLFLTELSRLLDVPSPEPACADDSRNHYVFERTVVFHHGDGSTSSGFIDLYKRGCFVLEAKQGANRPKADADPVEQIVAAGRRTRRGTATRGSGAWDDAMLAARGQAEQYVRALPDDNPPFIVVVDVGHSIELYSDFSRLGKTYTPFPDARSHRIFLPDLAKPELRERLRQVWTDPLALDPARRTARVTREIAGQLAELAKSLERDHDPEDVATFLMRCLFTLFAEDVGLIPNHSFTALLKSLVGQVSKFPRMAEAVWKDMNDGGFSVVLREDLLRFNGGLFQSVTALPLSEAQLELLTMAAQAQWQQVEPAIFGTLLERALDSVERHKLGAHYTPRAYVERLVLPTVIEPLREEWAAAQAAAVTLARAGKLKEAVGEVQTFLKKLCNTTVLDPACGSGNFLYVTLEHMKRLEGEVRDALHQLGEGQSNLEYTGHTVDPHQLRGIEINPRAAAIADLVLWIGYLQWHFRTHGNTMPAEPVLKKFNNIECRDAVLAYDRQEFVTDEKGKPVTRWDGRTFKKHPVTGEDVPDETATVPVYKYINPRKAEWPKADYVVGNPPFIGGWLLRQSLGDGYVEALWSTYEHIPEKADYVMYWWDRAAQLARTDQLRRFGYITTNSITQVFQRRVVAQHLSAHDAPLRLLFAIADHPWVDSENAAAVRIAMTVGSSNSSNAKARIGWVVNEEGGENAVEVLTSEASQISEVLRDQATLSSLTSLRSNDGLCSPGVQLYGAGFIVPAEEVSKWRAGGDWPVLRETVRPYLNGRDLMGGTRQALVIDFFNLDKETAAKRYPRAFQRVLDRVKPERDQNRRASIRDTWWRFGWERPVLRRAVDALTRFISTPETSKHRVFVFLEAAILPDNMLTNIALEDAFFLGVLSARIHTAWALAVGGRLEDRPRYTKAGCYDPFPFPVCDASKKQRIRELGEALDAHRKRQQAAHPGLTMTDMYNVLAKLRSGEALTDKDKRIHEQGLVSVLKQIHDDLDAAVFDAYAWPADLTDEQILERLVALNAERAEEERNGLIRWLRPEFQNPQGATEVQSTLNLDQPEDQADDRKSQKRKRTPAQGKRASAAQRGAAKGAVASATAKAPWPPTLPEQAQALRAALAAAAGPVKPEDIARCFLRAPKERVAELLDTLVSLGQARRVDAQRYVL